MTKTDSLNIKDVGAAAVETMMAAKQAAQDLARSMASRIEEIKDQSAGALHSGASSVRSASQRGSAAMAGAGERVAGKLDAASSYIAAAHAPNLTGALRHSVRRHPVAFLIGAAAVGFCAANALNRKVTPQATKEEIE